MPNLPSKKSKKTSAGKPLPTFRRAASKFRLNPDRDDHNPGFDTVRVFIPSPLLHGGDIGVSGAACVMLMGYAISLIGAEKLTSVRSAADARIVGRMVDLHPDELARLDQVAEHAGEWHRFLAEVVGPQTGSVFSVWVFQALSDATAVELKTSAAELPRPAARHLKLLNN